MTSKKKKSLEEKDKEIDVIDKEESTSELKFYIDNRLKESRISIKKAWKNFIYDIKHPRKAIVELFKSKYFVINAIAIVVGIIGALSAWAFEWLVEGANIIFLQKLFPLIAESFNAGRFLAIIITPLLAVLLTAPLIWIFNPESKGSGIPNVMESIALYDGYMRKRTPFVKLFTSAICSGGGLSVGKEGPITQIGAGFSSGIAHIVGLHGRNMKIVVISGLSAAIAATFNSPIGGALFGIEILLVSLIADEIVPIILASLTSSTFSALIDILKLSPHSTGIPEPSFKVDVLRNLGWTSFIYDLHWFLILGIIAGLIGVFYSKFFHLVRELFDRLPISKLYIPIFGAILSGLVALLSPKESSGVPLIFGGSYSTITNILNNDVTTLSNQNPLNSLISFMVILLLLKLLMTSFSVGTGNPGGIFAPALFIGACSGSFFAMIVNTSSRIDVNISIFALAGLAAVFGGATRAPLTMIFMGAEMTGNITLMIPLMLTCSISYLVCRGLMKESIYTQQLIDKGLRITQGGNVTLLTTTKVEEIMTKEFVSVKKGTSIKEIVNLVQIEESFSFPVIDERNKLQGIITLSDIKRAKARDELNNVVDSYMATNLITITADKTIDEALNIMNRSQIKSAPVIDNEENFLLIGMLSKNDILKGFEKENIIK